MAEGCLGVARQLPLFASNMVAKGRPSKADSTWKILASLEVVPSLRQKPPRVVTVLLAIEVSHRFSLLPTDSAISAPSRP